jgi:hypothetical protein
MVLSQDHRRLPVLNLPRFRLESLMSELQAKLSPSAAACREDHEKCPCKVNVLSPFCTPQAAVYNVRPELMAGFQQSPLILLSRNHR